MLCSRSCPDWCIYIEGHKTKAPPRRPGGKERTVSALDRFDIDYALCMYCGICVEVCPFDALVLEPGVRVLRASPLRPAPRRGPPQRVDGDGARTSSPTRPAPTPRSARCRADGRPEHLLLRDRRRDRVQRASGWSPSNNVVHAALHLVAVLASVAAQYILLAAEFVAATQVLVYIGAIVVLFLFGIMLTRAKIGRRPGPHQQALAGWGRHRPAPVRGDGLRACSTSTTGARPRCRPTLGSSPSTGPTPPP